MKTKQKQIKKEVSRLKKFLSKHSDHVIIHISWNRKWENNKITIKNVNVLKEKGALQLVGIVYFTILKRHRSFMGQTMLLLNNNKEISYTTFFINKKSIQFSYDWERGLQLMAMYVHENIA